jgi:nucleotide-binding universal stress UspA family protein
MVHATTVYETDEPRQSTALADYSDLVADHQAQIRDRLAELRERYEGRGVEISHKLIDGFADSGLCEAATELDAEMICVGTHGRTGIKRFFLGSVSEKVARIFEGAVLVARDGRPRGGYRRILVPTDFSGIAETALDAARSLAADDAEIDLLHCWQLPVPVTTYYIPTTSHGASLKQLAVEMEADAKRRGEALAESFRSDGIELSVDVVESSPAEGIIERSAGYDLIAMGSHGHRGFKRFVLGSVAEQTVRHAPCSVFITHAGAIESTADNEV